jgi:ectoine hydroxylase-related dioxygenase (phytanoyl-CoA dioxygenase family)
MPTPRGAVDEYRRRWHETGWCVIEGVIPASDLADAQAAIAECFPTAGDFSRGVDPDRNAAFLSERDAPRLQFPYPAAALDRVALHDNILDVAVALLDTDDPRIYQAGAFAKYAGAGGDYEQLLHADYANHTFVVPRANVGHQLLETFVYLSDVTPTTGATRFVDLEHTRDIPVERTYLHLEEYAELYAREQPASGPAGSLLVYRPDVFHRGVAITEAGTARFVLNVACKRPGQEWVGFHAFPARGEDAAWHRFMRTAGRRQLCALGFPPPGDAYWTTETLAGVAARYPALDLTAWRDASG